ncbi:SAM-dependent methyltransferase [Streptomyces tremellae]|uniref:Uncharacterized protein n=1 Tax=Streptomyces tremellae TaxID=1124239 RepID=A0ABP7FJL5_9ACTN
MRVLHFFDDSAAARLVRGHLRPLAPGSCLGLSQAGGDDAARPALSTYGERVRHVHMRGRAEVTAFFDGPEPVEPGVVLRPEWHPDPGVPLDAGSRAVLRARAGHGERTTASYPRSARCGTHGVRVARRRLLTAT